MFDEYQLEKNEMEYLEVQILCLFMFVISEEATKKDSWSIFLPPQIKQQALLI